MNKKIYDGYTYVDGGVCAAKGFTANGLNCGLNLIRTRMILEWYFQRCHVWQQACIHRTR